MVLLTYTFAMSHAHVHNYSIKVVFIFQSFQVITESFKKKNLKCKIYRNEAQGISDISDSK